MDSVGADGLMPVAASADEPPDSGAEAERWVADSIQADGSAPTYAVACVLSTVFAKVSVGTATCTTGRAYAAVNSSETLSSL